MYIANQTSSSMSIFSYHFLRLYEPSVALKPFSITKNNATVETSESVLEHYTRRIHSFANLEEGWNGDKAKPIPFHVIQNALVMLSVVRIPGLEIYPTGRESIQFEYDNDHRSLEIEIFSDRFEVALFEHVDLVLDERFPLSESERANDYIAQLYEN